MNPHFKKGIRTAVIISVLSLGMVSLPACDNETDGSGDKDVGGDLSAQSAYIRVIHLSPNAPDVDVFINGWTMSRDLGQFEASDYFEIGQGEHDVDISAAGTGIEQAVKSIDDLSLEAGKYYTAFAYGDVADLRVGLVVDDFSESQKGHFRVRAVHTAFDFGEVDIWNLTEGQESSILYENVPFGAIGSYIELPVNAYTLGLDADDDGRPEAVFEVPRLAQGTVVNLFAVSEAPAVFLLAQAQMGQPVKIDVGVAEVRLIHISPDSPAVDAWMNDRAWPFTEGLGFGEGTEYSTIYAGLHNFHIAPAGTSPEQAVLHSHDLFLRPGRSYTVAAYSTLADLRGMLLEDDTSPLDVDKIRVRPIHTASGIGAVDIWSLNRSGMSSQLYEALGFASVGSYVELPLGEYTLGFDVDMDSKADVTFEIPKLPGGTIANVYAVNDGAKVSLIAQLGQGTTALIDSK